MKVITSFAHLSFRVAEGLLFSIFGVLVGLAILAILAVPAHAATFFDNFSGSDWSYNYNEGGCFNGGSPYAQVPPGWTGTNLSPNRCIQKETWQEQYTSSPYSIKLTNKDNSVSDNQAGIALAQIYKNVVDAVPGASYTVTGYSYRFYGRSADFVGLQFCSLGCGTISWYPLYGKHVTQTWYNFSEGGVVAPSGTNSVNVYLGGGINEQDGTIGQSNDVYFDDVRLLEVLPASPSPTPIPGPKTCSVSVSPNSVVSGSSTTVSVSGNAYRTESETVRLWAEQQSGAQITGSISPAASPSTCGSGKYCYNITSANCTTSNSTSCSSTTSVTLPVGNYYFHCDIPDVPTDSRKCSGNPFCSYEGLGGTINCSPWESCSTSDNTAFSVVTPSGNITFSQNPCTVPVEQSTCTAGVTYTYSNTPGGTVLCWSTIPASSDISGTTYTNNFSPGSHPFSLRTPAKISGLWNCTGGTLLDSDTLVVNPPPSLGNLQITADTAEGGVTTGPYGITGLREDEGGSNYYNALLITQNVDNGNLAALVGTAFTSKESGWTPTNSSLYQLTRSAYHEKGFVLLYANRARSNVPYYNGITSSNQSFTQNKYYVYSKNEYNVGVWSGALSAGNIYGSSTLGLTATVRGGGASAPRFSVTFYKAIGNHKWGTYGYIMDQSGGETATYVQTPSP